VNYGNYTGYTKTSGTDTVYIPSNKQYIRIKAKGYINLYVAKGATITINAAHASTTDSAARTIQLKNGSADVGTTAVFQKGAGATSAVLAENLAEGVYSVTASNDININYIQITFASVDSNIIKGDADDDGDVTENDVKTILNYVIKKIQMINNDNADVDGDNKITVKDARIIAAYLNGVGEL
ncbi:MAG: dockerin type I repeat-containing protein, partial [Firmicutes bacterium]|nr:dockerin type I repeat-containing protein [Bacillota bacterium]